METKTPNQKKPSVQLTGHDGNVFAIIGTCRRALRSAGYDHGKLVEFTDEAMAGDYDHALRTCMKWCDVS